MPLYTLQFYTKDFSLTVGNFACVAYALNLLYIASTDYRNGFDEWAGCKAGYMVSKVRLFEKSSVRRENLGSRLLSGSSIGWFHYLFVWNKFTFFSPINLDDTS